MDVPTVGQQQGTSNFPYFIDRGNAEETRRSWLLHSQWGDGENGEIQRTIDGGESWTRADSLLHGHGNSQIFQAAKV
jgi:photosystem II stability/assembly factor-like uncharacterized protein